MELEPLPIKGRIKKEESVTLDNGNLIKNQELESLTTRGEPTMMDNGKTI